MANEITIGYYTGATLTYGIYEPDGTVRTAAGTSLPEEGATGYYHATNANVVAGDIVIVKEGTAVVAYGEYLPNVSASGVTADIAAVEAKIDVIDGIVDTIDGKIDTVDTNVDLLIVEQQRVNNVYVTEDTSTKPRILYL